MSTLNSRARALVDEAAIGVARGRRQSTVQMMYNALIAAQNEAEPRLIELTKEVATLRKALAHHYHPTSEELENWYGHCETVSSCGGNPPDYKAWKTELALSHYEYGYDN